MVRNRHPATPLHPPPPPGSGQSAGEKSFQGGCVSGTEKFLTAETRFAESPCSVLEPPQPFAGGRELGSFSESRQEADGTSARGGWKRG